MAGEDRTASDAVALLRALERKPFAFHFLQALRRLECVSRARPRLGASLRPADDPIRLGQEPSLAFAPSTIAAFRPGAGGRPARLLVHFFGSFGPNGPLPLHLTEYARDRQRNASDPTLVRFLDLFHHRLLTLFYRAWSQAEPTVQFDRPAEDRFATYVGALSGRGGEALRDRDAMPDLAKWFFTGRLAAVAKNPEGLRAILTSFLGTPVRVEEFVGHWMELPEDCRTRLGERPETGRLGQGAIAGSRVWDCQTKFRLVVGPVAFADYVRLLPYGDTAARLAAIVRNYVGDELAWDVKLVLRKEEVPRTCLGRTGRLGYTTWVVGRAPEADAEDFVIDLSARLHQRSAGPRAGSDRSETRVAPVPMAASPAGTSSELIGATR